MSRGDLRLSRAATASNQHQGSQGRGGERRLWAGTSRKPCAARARPQPLQNRVPRVRVLLPLPETRCFPGKTAGFSRFLEDLVLARAGNTRMRPKPWPPAAPVPPCSICHSINPASTLCAPWLVNRQPGGAFCGHNSKPVVTPAKWAWAGVIKGWTSKENFQCMSGFISGGYLLR